VLIVARRGGVLHVRRLGVVFLRVPQKALLRLCPWRLDGAGSPPRLGAGGGAVASCWRWRSGRERRNICGIGPHGGAGQNSVYLAAAEFRWRRGQRAPQNTIDLVVVKRRATSLFVHVAD